MLEPRIISSLVLMNLEVDVFGYIFKDTLFVYKF